MKAIMDRKEIAKAINSGNYPVLKFDLDGMHCVGEFIHGGGGVNVAWDKLHYEGVVSECQLVMNEGKYKLLSSDAMLGENYNVFDFVDKVNRANNPVVHRGQVVAIANYSKKSEIFFVCMMRVACQIDVQGQVVAELMDVEDDFELQEVR